MRDTEKRSTQSASYELLTKKFDIFAFKNANAKKTSVSTYLHLKTSSPFARTRQNPMITLAESCEFFFRFGLKVLLSTIFKVSLKWCETQFLKTVESVCPTTHNSMDPGFFENQVSMQEIISKEDRISVHNIQTLYIM